MFISSFYPEKTCLAQLWYMSDEMIFFVFVPFIVMTYLNKRVLGYSVVSFIIMSSVIIGFTLSHVRKHTMTNMKDPDGAEYGREFYNYPYSRFGPYFIGILFGMMYYEWMKSEKDVSYKNTFGARFYNVIKADSWIRNIGFVISALVMISLILLPRVELQDLSRRVLSQWLSDIINAFQRQLFVLALAIFLSGPMVGKMNFVRGAFGGKLWAPWAKLTFAAYLLHTSVLALCLLGTKGSFYASGFSALFFSNGCFLITILGSIPIALVVESPVLQLERLVLFPPKEKKVKKEEEMEKPFISSKDSLNRIKSN